MTIVVVPGPAPSVLSRAKAPDGKPWPPPTILVDTSEQTPIAFGHVPAVWEPGAPVHYGQRADPSPLFSRLASPYPWQCRRANLSEGDYALADPRTGAPIELWSAVETKRGDLVSSMTGGRPRLEAEFARLARYKYPCLVASVSAERLIGHDCLRQPRSAMGKEASLIGTLMALSHDYRIPWYMMPDAMAAEYMVAWLLLRDWRTWLVETPDGLAEVRRLEAIDRAHGRPEVATT